MKTLFYFFAVILFCSCSNKKPEVQVVTATPTGMEGLQKTAPIATANAQTKSNLIFNPPHGQAGHNCDLAVGAPLNQTAPIKPQEIPAQPKVAVAPATTEKNSNKTLNPAHGKPNHRCDIAVGASLDSKPLQKATVIDPTENKNLEANNATKLNPEHGKPNHRCDIAVGAPLT